MNHQEERRRIPALRRRSSRLAQWTLIISISISFVILSLSILGPQLARTSVQNHDSKFDMTQAAQSNHSVVGEDTRHYQSSEAGGTEASCTFCKTTLNEPELVVAGTGGNTCRSIQLLAAKELNGSDICALIQKEERVCCPGPESVLHHDTVPVTTNNTQNTLHSLKEVAEEKESDDDARTDIGSCLRPRTRNERTIVPLRPPCELIDCCVAPLLLIS